MKTKFIILCGLLCGVLSISAQQYRILYLNTPSIRIGSQDKRIGDVFAAADPIQWQSNEQVMKVKNTETQDQYVLCQEQMQKICASNTLKAYHRVTKGLYTRATDDDPIAALAQQFSQEACVENELRLPFTQKETGATYYITYRYNEEFVKKTFTQTSDALVLSRAELYDINGKIIQPIPVEAELYQYQASSQTATILATGFIIPIQ